MTEENYNYRTSQTLLRNQFPGKGKLKIPVIPKFQENPGDFDDLLLIGFDKTHPEDQNHLDRMVHFFLYDYRFERVWKNPDSDIEKLSRYRAVLSPDFSMYLEMAPVMQLYNVFRNRWCGAYWASKGIRVIPTVNWGDESTFDFCFEGIEKGSVVAVSTIWHLSMITAATIKNGSWLATMKCFGVLSRRKLFATTRPFLKCRGTLCMWTMGAARGDI